MMTLLLLQAVGNDGQILALCKEILDHVNALTPLGGAELQRLNVELRWTIAAMLTEAAGLKQRLSTVIERLQ